MLSVETYQQGICHDITKEVGHLGSKVEWCCNDTDSNVSPWSTWIVTVIDERLLDSRRIGPGKNAVEDTEQRGVSQEEMCEGCLLLPT